MHTATRPRITDLGESPQLPRLNGHAVRALNRLYDPRLEPAALALRGDPVTLRWDADACPAVFERYRFSLGPHAGWLGLDPHAQSLLMAERHADLLPRELRYVLLADALSPLVERLERVLHMRFEWAPEQDAAASAESDGRHAACFELDASASGQRCHGFVQFDDPASLDALVPQGLPRRALHGGALDFLRLPLAFCIGFTSLRVGEVRSIRPGDIISLEAWDSAKSAIVVTADFGSRRLFALAEGARITLQDIKDSAMDRDATATAAAAPVDAGGNQPLDRLDALEVTLRFEVGDLPITLGELKSLRAGHVFELAQPLNRSTVKIVVHGNVLGKGHLVAVGDQLGVRVSEFAPSDL